MLLGLVPGHALIETVGRNTGRSRRTVVAYSVQDDAVWIVAEQGGYCDYVRNLQANPRVRLRLPSGWRDGTAELVDDDDPHRRLDAFGRPGHARAVRNFGTSLLSIRIRPD